MDPKNPIGLMSHAIRDHFNDMHHLTYPSPVVTIDDNFDSLLVPKDHVSRSKHDTYYLNKDLLLRCHTSAHQGHGLTRPSRQFVCVADVYRRDAIDATHYPVFHQCEIFKLFKDEDIGHTVMKKNGERTEDCQEVYQKEASDYVRENLKQTIEQFIRRLMGTDLEMRWVSAYFPFTHPSLELEILWKGKWLEILGCGIVEHKLLTNHKVYDQIAWAAGFGIERLAMLRYSIPDIRLFWSTDSGFLSQFKDKDPWDQVTYKPISSYPQCISDMSFWLPSDGAYSSNDFYDIVRSVGGDLVEQVELIDDFLNPKNQKRSHCYRIIYRSNERTLTQKEVNELHKKIGETVTTALKVQLRL